MVTNVWRDWNDAPFTDSATELIMVVEASPGPKPLSISKACRTLERVAVGIPQRCISPPNKGTPKKTGRMLYKGAARLFARWSGLYALRTDGNPADDPSQSQRHGGQGRDVRQQAVARHEVESANDHGRGGDHPGDPDGVTAV